MSQRHRQLIRQHTTAGTPRRKQLRQIVRGVRKSQNGYGRFAIPKLVIASPNLAMITIPTTWSWPSASALPGHHQRLNRKDLVDMAPG